MQRVVIDEPYEFVPPVYSEWWPTALRFILRPYLRKSFGIHSIECRHVERLKASLAALPQNAPVVLHVERDGTLLYLAYKIER